MIVTKKHIARRTVLRGLGVSLALPWLDSMVPALTAFQKSGARTPRRLAAFYGPNGMALPFWRPKAEGSLEELPPILQPLQPFKNDVLMIGGLNGDAANGGSHAEAS